MTSRRAQAPSGRFAYPRSTEVIYGPGSLGELPAAVERLGASRVFAIASRTLVDAGLEHRLAELLGDRWGGLYAGVPQHVPRSTVLAAAAAARDADADLLLSVGGGTPIDCAKAVALCLALGFTSPPGFDEHRVRFSVAGKLHIPAMPEVAITHVSVPTTLSGGEHTNLFGVTDPERHIKDLFTGESFTPRTVILDAELACTTPDWLWGASAVRAIDHAVEGILSRRHVAFMDALGLEALRLLRGRLLPSLREPGDLAARTECQVAAWLAIYGLTNVGSGLSHAIGHQLAATFDMLHGVTSAVMLPHVMRFNAAVSAARIVRIAEPMGLEQLSNDEETSMHVVDAITALIAELEPFGVPHTLRTAGAQRALLEGVADRVMQDMGVAVNPRPVTRADLLAMFDAAW